MSAIHPSQYEQLKKHSPFDRMEQSHLTWMVAHMQLGYYAQGDVIASPGQGKANKLYLIKQGWVKAGHEAAGEGDAVLELHEGETFPLGALMANRPVSSVYRAGEDAFCLELDKEDFEALLAMSPAFSDFCTRRIAALFEQSTAQMQTRFAHVSTEQQSLTHKLGEITRRAPVTCNEDAVLQEVLQRMQTDNLGSMIIVSGDQQPVGIFTLRDLRDRVMLQGRGAQTRIGEVMTRQPVTLSRQSLAFEAAMAMAQKGVSHILVQDESGKVCGIVSERDLFSVQRVGLKQISSALHQARSVQELTTLSADIRELARNLLAQGMAAEQLTQMLSALNDALAKRVIELETAASDDDVVAQAELCWMIMGSGGRYEQTLNTDQDNALIFVPLEGMTEEQMRAHLLPLAQRVNQALDRCGFPLCKGNIMASNPRWCLSLAEWQEVFYRWVDHGSNMDLMHATIFFDFRALAGREEMAEALRKTVTELVRKNTRFQHQMAAHALSNRPPLGLLRDFVLNERDRIDLKINGLTPFVDAARIFSFAAGGQQVGTLARLREAAEQLKIKPADVEAWAEAFLFIQMQRLRHHYEISEAQRQNGDAAVLDNLIEPAQLNELDRRILKEAFRQARKIQSRLALDYQL